MPENEPRRDTLDETERLTYRDLGAEKATGRIQSNVGRVEDPQAVHDKLHQIKTYPAPDKPPYNWQKEENKTLKDKEDSEPEKAA